MGLGALTASFALISQVAHGGRLDAARRLFANAPEPWIDLSTGVNPRAYPAQTWPDSALTRLPDENAFKTLEAAARVAYRPPPDAQVVSGAGVQTFIQIMPRAFTARRVAILGFTYAEHAACWRDAGAQITNVDTIEELSEADVAVIVNPNNPDGRLIPVPELSTLAQKMARRGALVVVDESFMDFMPQHSFAASTALDGVIVLRSFGKTYGLPGLRLGFALCALGPAKRLRSLLGPWAVCGPALAIGAQALQDRDWLATAALCQQRDAMRLDDLLQKAGFDIVGGCGLFRLAYHRDARTRFLSLCQHGVLTRDFAERPAWLRFGLPGNEDEWSRLAAALEVR